MSMLGRRATNLAMWAFVLVAVVFLYAPLVPPAIKSFSGVAPGDGTFAHYAAILADQRLTASAWTSFVVGLAVAVVTPLLALLLAEAVRVWRIPRVIISIVLIPLFVPGISMGLATALFFKLLGVPPSLLTIIAVQVIWALPFAFLILLTVMAGFDPIYLEAAHLCGANRLQAFFEVELPQIYQGILGAAIFSLILSFNETIRTSIVQGGHNTLQTYLWSQYQQVGLSPELFALMTVMIVATLALLAMLAVIDWRRGRGA